jgi:hypothetical protein
VRSRVCEQAQLVETVSQSARMAARIVSEHRWATTGTPIGKGGLDDLHGLMVFLCLEPFTRRSYWNHAVARPYHRGRTGPLLRLLRNGGTDNPRVPQEPLIWRQTKAHVAHELCLPPVTYDWVTLKFSPVEQQHYNRILEDIRSEVFLKVMRLEGRGLRIDVDGSGVAPVSDQRRAAERLASDQLAVLRGACAHLQARDDGPVLPMSEIGKKMVTQVCAPSSALSCSALLNAPRPQARSELTAAERELCRFLNVLADIQIAKALLVPPEVTACFACSSNDHTVAQEAGRWLTDARLNLDRAFLVADKVGSRAAAAVSARTKGSVPAFPGRGGRTCGGAGRAKGRPRRARCGRGVHHNAELAVQTVDADSGTSRRRRQGKPSPRVLQLQTTDRLASLAFNVKREDEYKKQVAQHIKFREDALEVTDGDCCRRRSRCAHSRRGAGRVGVPFPPQADARACGDLRAAAA